MPVYRNIAGTWRAATPWRNIAGTWKACVLWRNIAGTWKVVSGSRVTASKNNINANGFSKGDSTTISSITGSTGWSFSVISGDGSRLVFGPSSGASTTLGINTPATGNGSVSGVCRVTASYGDYVDISFSANWGTA